MRNKADNEVEKIKSVLKLFGLDYFVQESTFSVSIQIKKSFFQDYSPQLTDDLTNQTSIPVWPQLVPSQPFLSPEVLLQTPQSLSGSDSGVHTQESLCSSCDDKDGPLEEVRKEIVKVLVESNQTIDKLTSELGGKNVLLSQVENKLQRIEEEKSQLKN